MSPIWINNVQKWKQFHNVVLVSKDQKHFIDGVLNTIIIVIFDAENNRDGH